MENARQIKGIKPRRDQRTLRRQIGEAGWCRFPYRSPADMRSLVDPSPVAYQNLSRICLKGQAMPTTTAIALLIMIVAGAALAIQAPINAALGRSLGSPMAAGAVSFAGGFAVLLAITLALHGPQAFFQLASAPKWQLVGGLLGAFYVTAVLWGVPTLGVLSTMAALILGQIVMALVLDGGGAFGLPVHAISLQRVAAAALVASGLVLSRV